LQGIFGFRDVAAAGLGLERRQRKNLEKKMADKLYWTTFISGSP
jgi:hypothetical protein